VPAAIDVEAFGWVEGWTADTAVSLSWTNNACLYGNGSISVFNAAAGEAGDCEHGSIQSPVPADPFERTSFPFDWTDTTPEITAPGEYHATWSLIQPVTFFGFTLYTKTLVSTSTVFIMQAPTSFDVTLNNIASSTGQLGEAFATSTPNECSVLAIGDCVTLLFVPSANSLAFVKMTQLQISLMRKPPFGYFTLVEAELSTTTATSSATYLQGMSIIAPFFAFLRTGLSLLLWFMLLLWMFHRLRKFDFQA